MVEEDIFEEIERETGFGIMKRLFDCDLKSMQSFVQVLGGLISP